MDRDKHLCIVCCLRRSAQLGHIDMWHDRWARWRWISVKNMSWPCVKLVHVWDTYTRLGDGSIAKSALYPHFRWLLFPIGCITVRHCELLIGVSPENKIRRPTTMMEAYFRMKIGEVFPGDTSFCWTACTGQTPLLLKMAMAMGVERTIPNDTMTQVL